MFVCLCMYAIKSKLPLIEFLDNTFDFKLKGLQLKNFKCYKNQ